MKKKILAVIAAVAIAMPVFAQFKLTSNGFESAEGKPYVVFNIEGSQKDLFNKCKSAVTSVFTSAKDVLSFNEPDIIVINGATSPDEFTVKRVMNYKFGMTYRIQIQFKDGRIRVDAPSATLTPCLGIKRESDAQMSLGCGGSGSSGGTYHLFDKNGKCRNEKTAEQIETYMNGVVNALVDKMQNNAVDEDW